MFLSNIFYHPLPLPKCIKYWTCPICAHSCTTSFSSLNHSINAKSTKLMLRRSTSGLIYISIKFDFYRKNNFCFFVLVDSLSDTIPIVKPIFPPLPPPPPWPTAAMPVHADTSPQKPKQCFPPQRAAKCSIFMPSTYCGRGGLLQWWLQQQNNNSASGDGKEQKDFKEEGAINSRAECKLHFDSINWKGIDLKAVSVGGRLKFYCVVVTTAFLFCTKD